MKYHFKSFTGVFVEDNLIEPYVLESDRPSIVNEIIDILEPGQSYQYTFQDLKYRFKVPQKGMTVDAFLKKLKSKISGSENSYSVNLLGISVLQNGKITSIIGK